jgi:putative transcriptional regulator
MLTRLTWVVLAACLFAVPVAAAEPPAKGKLLVATEVIRGDIFVQTVVLLLHYDKTGAVGLVVNRPTEVALDEVLEDPSEFSDYEGRMYWGGPVQMNSIRALMQTDSPTKGADLILESVYLVPFNVDLKKSLGDASRLHFFIGYAGWAPGQLDRELEIGSWHVLPASADIVFADDPGLVWKRLAPREDLRTSIEMKNSLSGLDHRG